MVNPAEIAVERLMPSIRSFARRVAIRPDQVDDFVQEGCIGAWRGYKAYASDLSQLNLVRVMMRCAINAIRSAQRRMVVRNFILPLGSNDSVIDEVDPALRIAERDAINEAMREAGLNGHQRDKISKLLMFPGIRQEDMAGALDVSRATISRILARIRRALMNANDTHQRYTKGE